MNRRKTRTVPVGAMLAALAFIAIAVFFVLIVGDDTSMAPPRNDQTTGSATENR